MWLPTMGVNGLFFVGRYLDHQIAQVAALSRRPKNWMLYSGLSTPALLFLTHTRSNARTFTLEVWYHAYYCTYTYHTKSGLNKAFSTGCTCIITLLFISIVRLPVIADRSRLGYLPPAG